MAKEAPQPVAGEVVKKPRVMIDGFDLIRKGCLSYPAGCNLSVPAYPNSENNIHLQVCYFGKDRNHTDLVYCGAPAMDQPNI